MKWAIVIDNQFLHHVTAVEAKEGAAALRAAADVIDALPAADSTAPEFFVRVVTADVAMNIALRALEGKEDPR